MVQNKQLKFALRAFVLGLALTACGKDKTLDQYQDEQAQKELAEQSKANGTYRGTISVEGSGQVAAATADVEIYLYGATDPVKNGSGTGTSEQAGLKGYVKIRNGSSESTAPISSGRFRRNEDSDSDGTVNVVATISAGGTTYNFAVTGTKKGAALSGTISPTNVSGGAGTFSTVNGAEWAGQHQTNPGLHGDTSTYTGTYRDSYCDGTNNSIYCPGRPDPQHPNVPSPDQTVRMTVSRNPVNSDLGFVNFFVTQKTVLVTLSFGRGQEFTLVGAQLGDQGRKLHFQGSPSGQTNQVILDCTSAAAGYSCTYQTIRNTLTFNAVPSVTR